MVTEEQFIALYVRHEPELRSFAHGLMPHSGDAPDVLQEACLAMWRKINTLESGQAFRSWAYSYVRFTALNLQRKHRASPLRFSDDLLETIADEWEEESDFALDQHEALTECLEKLPGFQHRMLALYYADGRNTAEKIAGQLNRPVAGVYKALARARETLRRCIEFKLQPGGES